jgi:hypothetical protein
MGLMKRCNELILLIRAQPSAKNKKATQYPEWLHWRIQQ